MTTAATQPKPGRTNTLTIRRLPDECVATLKQAAKDNNRSMEAEVRSILEEFTAEWLAHQVTTSADLVEEMERLLGGEGLDGDEQLCPPRNAYDHGPRPVDFGDAGDQEDTR